MPRVARRVGSRVDEDLFGFLPMTPVLVSCISREGRPNIIPLISWSFVCRWPPKMTIGICETRHPPGYFARASYRMVLDTGEFVVNFPDGALRDAVTLTGSLSANDPAVDKFKAAGLTPGKALVVKAPLIEECPISVECVVTEHQSLGSHHIFVGEVVAVHQWGEIARQESRAGVDVVTYRSADGGPGKKLVWSGYPWLRDVAAAGEEGKLPAGIPVISVVGRSGSGKTTLLEKLIGELKRRGYLLAVVKHHYHTGLPFDVPGKDSQRLAEAGADRVVVAAPDKLVSVQRLEREPTLAEVTATIRDVDLIITEGFKREHAPKIQVSRAELGGEGELLCPPEELIALVADYPFAVPVVQFGLDDVAGLADLIEARFLAVHGR